MAPPLALQTVLSVMECAPASLVTGGGWGGWGAGGWDDVCRGPVIRVAVTCGAGGIDQIAG